MANFDQALSPRLGQRTSNEGTAVLMFEGTEIPEAAWRGQMIYRTDQQIIQVFNGDAWENVVGSVAGLLTFVGSVPPVAQNVGDLWYDSANDHKLYRAYSIGANEIAAGEWQEVLIGSAALATELTGKTLTGGLIRTAASGERVEISSEPSSSDDLRFYTADSDEDDPARIGSVALGLDGIGFAILGAQTPQTEIRPQILMFSAVEEDYAKIEVITNEFNFGGAWVRVPAGIQIGGKDVAGIDFGRKDSGTTDSNSRVTVNHDLGTSPVSVTVTAAGGGSGKQYSIFSVSSTEFQVTVRSSSGALVGSGVSVDFFWQAMR